MKKLKYVGHSCNFGPGIGTIETNAVVEFPEGLTARLVTNKDEWVEAGDEDVTVKITIPKAATEEAPKEEETKSKGLKELLIARTREVLLGLVATWNGDEKNAGSQIALATNATKAVIADGLIAAGYTEEAPKE